MFVFEFVLVALIFVVITQIVRVYNAERFPVMAGGEGASTSEKLSYPTGDGVTSIEGEYLNGFHFVPAEKRHRGVVVVYGGSEGSPAYDRAEQLAGEGYEVLSLYFFGQPNQEPSLVDVPLDHFRETTTYIADHVEDSGPVTVIGTSKGAELALLLAAHAEAAGFAVDNVVGFAPAHYSYSGLDMRRGMGAPSFTLGGEPVPFASLRNISMLTGWKLMWDSMTGYPTSYRASYEQAVANSGGEGAIDLRSFGGNVLLFAGDGDRMWQSEVAAEALAAQTPHVEAHVFPGAGHAFFPDGEEQPDGWQQMLGGTVEGKRAAYEASEEILRARLAEWHR